VGKTLVAAGLLAAAADRGLRTLGLKPVAAGCDDLGRNEDALLLQSVMTERLDYDRINPIALRAAIAPHLAAEREGRSLRVDRIAGHVRGALLEPHDFVLVEGAGGWRVPLNSRETLADLARELDFPVILVVGMRLGCLNHALLTAETVLRDGLSLAGWVANRIDPDMDGLEENVDTLRSWLPAPLLGEVPHRPGLSPAEISRHIDMKELL